MRIQDYLLWLLITAVVAGVALFCKTWITEFAKLTFEKFFKKGSRQNLIKKQTTVAASDGSSAISESPGAVSVPQRQEVGEGGKAIQAGPGAYVSEQSGALEQVRDVYNVAPGGNLTIINNPVPSIEEYEKSLESLKKELEAEKKESLELLYEKGLEATKQGEFEDALESFKRATSKGDTPVLRLALSSTYFSLNQFEEAVEEADQARSQLNAVPLEERERCLAAGLNAKGIALLKARQLDPARKALEQSLNIWRGQAAIGNLADLIDLAGVLNNLGILYDELGCKKEAEEHSQNALAIYSMLIDKHPGICEAELAGTLNNLGALADGLGRKEEAEEYYQKALQRWRELAKKPNAIYKLNLSETLNNLGGVVFDLGRKEEAEGYFKEALDIGNRFGKNLPDMFEPNLAGTLNNLGVLVSELGRKEEAENYHKKALEMRRKLAAKHPATYDPDLANTLNNRGVVVLALGRTKEAEEHHEEAMGMFEKLAGDQPVGLSYFLCMSHSPVCFSYLTSHGLQPVVK